MNAKAFLAGPQHRRENIPCSDFVRTGKINGISYAALADGAGGKKYGRETASCLVSAVKPFLIQSAWPDGETEQGIKVAEYMNAAAKKCRLPLNQMGSTFLLILVKNGIYHAFHVGDGVIIARLNGIWQVLSYPENGVFANQTFFLPSEEPRIKSYMGRLSDDFCFILASDGISYTLYNGGIVSSACETIYGWCKKYSEKECSQILRQNLVEVFDCLNSDDKSIAVLAA